MLAHPIPYRTLPYRTHARPLTPRLLLPLLLYRRISWQYEPRWKPGRGRRRRTQAPRWLCLARRMRAWSCEHEVVRQAHRHDGGTCGGVGLGQLEVAHVAGVASRRWRGWCGKSPTSSRLQQHTLLRAPNDESLAQGPRKHKSLCSCSVALTRHVSNSRVGNGGGRCWWACMMDAIRHAVM